MLSPAMTARPLRLPEAVLSLRAARVAEYYALREEVSVYGTPLKYAYDDGGRYSETGLIRETTDCAVRAIAIATRTPYVVVYRHFLSQGQNPANGGLDALLIANFLHARGWVFTSLVDRQWLRSRFVAESLPSGRIIAYLGAHTSAVVRHTVRDVYYPTHRDGLDYVYGYWQRGVRA